MQKVVGSSPIIRLNRSPASAGLFCAPLLLGSLFFRPADLHREQWNSLLGMSERRIETILYDADDKPTSDEAMAVRAETVEVDGDGNVVERHAHDDLSWEVDPISLEGDAGEAATRPQHESD
jgi:hypothetical protein